MKEDDRNCCLGGRTEECRQAGECECIHRLPNYRRTDKILYSRPKPPKEKVPYGYEKKNFCSHDDDDPEVLTGHQEPCKSYFGKLEPTPLPTVGGIRLIPEGGDWTRFDVVSDVEDSQSSARTRMASSQNEGSEDEETSGEGEDRRATFDKCQCTNPFCKTCKFVNTSSESAEEVIVEKEVSYDDEFLDAVDSDAWLNPVARKKVLQFSSDVHRENYKSELLERMTRTAVMLPRTEWIYHVNDFDHYVTILMGESSSSSTSGDESDLMQARKQDKKIRRKKRLMYSVDNMKEHPSHHANYTRQYYSFMEDLKKQAAEPPRQMWPRFMKVFQGYGADNDEEEDPEWLGLLLMAPSECFREISSSSSCESLPHLSKPASTTSSITSTECSPCACDVDSTERLRRAGVCIAQNEDAVDPEKAHDSEGILVDLDQCSPDTKVPSMGMFDISSSSATILQEQPDKVPKKIETPISQQSFQPAASLPPGSNSQEQFGGLQPSNKTIQSKVIISSGSIGNKSKKFSIQAADLFRSLDSVKNIGKEDSSKSLFNLKKKFRIPDDITIIQQEKQPTTLGMEPLYQGEGPFNEVVPEFEMASRNIIFILRGKLYKMNYECYCKETCECDPQLIVEKYIDMLIKEVCGIPNFDEDDEDENEGNTVEEERDGCLDEIVSKRTKVSFTKEEGSKSANKTNLGKIHSPEKTVGNSSIVAANLEKRRHNPSGSNLVKDPDLNTNIKDVPPLPTGKYHKEDLVHVKARAPDGVEAYKDFYIKQEMKGLTAKSDRDSKGAKKDNKLLGGDPSDDSNSTIVSEEEESSISSSVSTTEESDSDSSEPLCGCCKCEKKYESSNMVVRRCDKKHCSCCTCKEKIVKIAHRLYTRRKGSRFLYILLKKIRKAINQPSKKTREDSLQKIVDDLKTEAQKFPRKKWPFFFKEIMVSAGLESSSGETVLSDQEGDGAANKKTKKKRHHWRYRRGKTNREQLTAADIQKQEWETWKAKAMEAEAEHPIKNYTVPQRAVLKIEDMTRWENSEAYYEYLGFILAMNEVIKGHSCKEKFLKSAHVEAIHTLLNRLSGWIDEIPPVQQPQRFGNKAFRLWIDRLNKEAPSILVELLPSKFHGGLGEAQVYLLEGFGNSTRIDYGTGHEMSFIMFLCCLFKIGVFSKDDELAVVLTIFTRLIIDCKLWPQSPQPAKGLSCSTVYLLEGFGYDTRIDYGTVHEMSFIMFLCCLFKVGVFIKLAVDLTIFTRYLDVARKLQTVYKMEPAGSRGVWALDDFQFIPFLWGSAQLIGHPHIRPTSFLKNEIVLGFYDHYMFLACVKYINENKMGPFAEHSNQLWNISAVPTWDKVNSGLIKMYKGEVLCKFPVIQHVLFGSILPITPAPPSQTERVYTGLVREGLQPTSRPKPCMEPPPPPPPVARETSATPSEFDDASLAEKFQNVPNQEDKKNATDT